MKRLNEFKGMYALLIAVAAVIGITIYGSCSADGDFWGFDEGYASTENTRAEKMDMSGFLKLPAGNPLKWTYEDYMIIQKAFTRMASSKTLIHEGAKIIVNKNTKACDLNISEELFNFIKDICGDGYDVSENDLGQSNKKKSFARKKTRDPENNNYHICAPNDYVGHAIAYYLYLDIDSVNNRIQTWVNSNYPDEPLTCGEILSALTLFNKSFVQQGSFWVGTYTPPYIRISGIVFTISEALNGKLVFFDGSSYNLIGYNAQKKKLKVYTLSENRCVPICAIEDSTHFAYYK